MTCRTEPAAAPTARVRRMSRREMDSLGILNVALSGFVEKVFGGAPRERHDGERGILVGIGDKRSTIGDEKIFHLVRLTETVENGSLGIGAHARSADFVNDAASSLDAEGKVAVYGSLGSVFAAHSFDNGAKRILHIFGLEQFVVGPLEVETKNRNAPLIDDIGIDFTVGIGIGNHFAPAGKADIAAVDFACALLYRKTIALFFLVQVVEHADAGHLAAAAKLNVIATREIVLAVEFPPGHVHMHAANTVVIVRGHFFKLREVTVTAAAGGVHEVFANGAGRVGEARGKKSGFGIQQQPRGFTGTGSNDDGARIDSLFGARGFVNVGDAGGFSVLVDEDFASHRTCDKRESARF